MRSNPSMRACLLAGWSAAAALAEPTAGAALRDQASGAGRSGAIDPLAKPLAEDVPRLLALVAQQGENWIEADAALGRSDDPRIVPYYIDLLERNFFEKEADGSRKQYGLGSPNGCMGMPFLYGGVLARRLGRAGDRRAIPVLNEAVRQGDQEVARNAYSALFDLGALRLDDLFERAKHEAYPRADVVELIVNSGVEHIHGDPRFAVELFDRVIAELPGHAYQVASAHYWKVQCFELLGQYADALRAADEVMKFPQYQNLTSQMLDRRPLLEAMLAESAAQATRRETPR